ncbi:MAG: hypothetical protein E5W70_28210 [Mesorhizobium sp.]|uniref:hypothetical protein n=1 Tax=Mesorhizobium sp. TaxID=1871066 RepID=UPI00122ADCE1|nr:hypothetical protein [Mesorhizobium sp.]TIT18720.1 MAG: hypothetical protein E5W70_28210 [Mesorhizobium sp.]
MRLLLFVLGSFATTSAWAQDVALACNYEWATNDKAERVRTSGDVSFLVHFTSDAEVQARGTKCGDLTGTATEVEIKIGCKYQQGGFAVTEDFYIDRVSGKMQAFWKYGDAGLVYEGHCVVTKPLF